MHEDVFMYHLSKRKTFPIDQTFRIYLSFVFAARMIIAITRSAYPPLLKEGENTERTTADPIPQFYTTWHNLS